MDGAPAHYGIAIRVFRRNVTVRSHTYEHGKELHIKSCSKQFRLNGLYHSRNNEKQGISDRNLTLCI